MTKHCVSVITAVHPPSVAYLPEAYRSLCAQDLPEEWTWQWIVQEDGQDGVLREALPEDGRISTGGGRRGGPGVARTMALARAEGELVKVLDADDRLAPGALSRDIGVLSVRPEVGWTTSAARDLLPDGTTAGFASDPPPGVLPRGSVLEHWRTHDHRTHVHPATLCLRHDLVVALGGWMALPASEDTGLLLAASTVSDGYFLAECGLLYRKWPGQVTQDPAHADPVERAARMRVIERRALALARLPYAPYGNSASRVPT
ncbi:glycosyltransferase [Amycolatopsis cynarae]|uniref:Glycosyltransferase n=1 Tax=Amycolatopsis cynarae TaxID=2995223 RepID=A0ABY7B6U9_9PSEU|nr:glycosyltransferase [Amycolatopsis sp. HUAS 11-8]WAL66913.1 glycosyltransferase [Amycolatopsis sp. HUAS 11-8]